MPDVAFEFVASAKGDVLTDSGLTLRATHDFTDFSTAPDVLLVPGGALPTFEALQDDALLDAIARAGEGAAWVTSVCTGALLLGAADCCVATVRPAIGPRVTTWTSSARYPTRPASSLIATEPAAAASPPASTSACR